MTGFLPLVESHIVCTSFYVVLNLSQIANFNAYIVFICAILLVLSIGISFGTFWSSELLQFVIYADFFAVLCLCFSSSFFLFFSYVWVVYHLWTLDIFLLLLLLLYIEWLFLLLLLLLLLFFKNLSLEWRQWRNPWPSRQYSEVLNFFFFAWVCFWVNSSASLNFSKLSNADSFHRTGAR